MTEQRKQPKMPEITIVREEDIRMVPVTGVFGSLSPRGGQMTFFHDTVIPEVSPKGEMGPKNIERHVALETFMSPQTFASIARWMMKKVEELEQFSKEQKEQQEEIKAEK